MIDPVPLSIAFVAGGLAILSPCAFPMLPAFLSLYVAADEDALPAALNRVAQGIVVGLLVSAGFLGLFATVAVPITLGASAAADAVPWVGVLLGAILALLGVRALLGKSISPAS